MAGTRGNQGKPDKNLVTGPFLGFARFRLLDTLIISVKLKNPPLLPKVWSFGRGGEKLAGSGGKRFARVGSPNQDGRYKFRER